MPLRDKEAYKSYQREYKRKRRIDPAWTKKYQQKNRCGKVEQARGLKYRYGLTVEQYDEMFDAQGGVCAICKLPETVIRDGKVRRLSVDHVHDPSKRVRGLLCTSCNVGIGAFKDEVLRLKEAIKYLSSGGLYGND